LKVCDSAYIINQGRIVEHGSPEKILQSKIARSCYLGDEFTL
jgi:lipopolysaccharide export system ATP-binding protein